MIDNARIIKRQDDLLNSVVNLEKSISCLSETIKFLASKKSHGTDRRSEQKISKSNKKLEKSSSGSSDDEEPIKKENNVLEEKRKRGGIIKILRNNKNLRVICDELRITTFSWEKEIDLLVRMWTKCRENNIASKEKAKKYSDKLLERNENTFTAPRTTGSDNNDKRIIDKRSKEKLSNVLKRNHHVPHPFVLQCLYQGCCMFYEDEDKLKEHLKKKHYVGDLITNNLNVYGLAQIYHKEHIIWKENGKASSIDNYWTKKENCIFENCLFRNHGGLKSEREHIKYYLEEVISMEEVTKTQVKIFEALSPVWKGMVLEKLYKELDWKETCLSNVFGLECELTVYNEGIEGKHFFAENVDEEMKEKTEEKKHKMIEERKVKCPKFVTKKNSKTSKNWLHDRLTTNYARGNRDKFIIRDVRKVDQAEKSSAKRRSPKSKIIVEPTKIKGYKWLFDGEEKSKEHGKDEMYEVLEWSKNMHILMKNLIPIDKIKVLYDKWVVIQSYDDSDVNVVIRQLQDEAINQAYEIRDFETMQRIAELDLNRVSSPFYEVVRHFCNEEGKEDKKYRRESNEWCTINRENRCSNDNIWLQHDRRYEELFTHMKRVCLARYRGSIAMGMSLSKFKENDKNCWYRKYLRILRDFYNEDFEKANREARDVVSEISNKSIMDNDLIIGFYLLGIDASIKAGNPDEDLIAQADRIATNDPSVLLRKLLMKIYYFEISRNNDIRISDTIDEIERIGSKQRTRFMRSLNVTEIWAYLKKIFNILKSAMKDTYIYVKEKVLVLI
jgi:hypothetical protein